MNHVLNIFNVVAEREGLTIGALEKSIGASKGVLSRAINNGTDVQSKWLLALIEKYPRHDYQGMLKGEFSTSGRPVKFKVVEENLTEGNVLDGGELDLKTVRDEIRGDLKIILGGMTENFKTVSDGIFHVLQDTQKLTKFIDELDVKGINSAGKDLRMLVKERK